MTIEEFKYLNGIDKVVVKKDDRCNYSETAAGKIFIPKDVNLGLTLYISTHKEEEYILSNYSKFDYSRIRNPNISLFSEESEGKFEITNSISLTSFCEMNGYEVSEIINKIKRTKGNYFTLSDFSFSIILHPFIHFEENLLQPNNLHIAKIGESITDLIYMYPNSCNALNIPKPIAAFEERINKFKLWNYSDYNYFKRGFQDEIKRKNSPIKGLTYQDVILKSQSFEFLFHCLLNFQYFNFDSSSMLLGVCKIADLENISKFSSTKECLRNFILLSKLKDDCSITYEEYLEIKKQNYFETLDNDKNENEFWKNYIQDGLNDAFEDNSSNKWNID